MAPYGPIRSSISSEKCLFVLLDPVWVLASHRCVVVFFVGSLRSGLVIRYPKAGSPADGGSTDTNLAEGVRGLENEIASLYPRFL